MVILLLDDRSLPPVITTSQHNSFPQQTILKRHPRIINQVIHDNDYTLEIRKRLFNLKEEIVNNAKIQSLTEDIGDQHQWNHHLDQFKNKTWLELPWYFAETFFYRRLLEVIDYFQPGRFRKRDPFHLSKRVEITRNMNTLTQTIDSLGKIEDVIRGFEQRLHASLWGNRLDLSNFTVKNTIKHHQATIERENIIINDFSKIYHTFNNETVSNIAFFHDNVGMELEFDLLLADFLLEKKWVETIVFYLKPYPFFVSDAMIKDLQETLHIFKSVPYSNVNDLGKRIHRALNNGTIFLSTDLFWASPYHYSEMSQSLSEELSQYDLIILKGDVDYRRLLSDRHWPYTKSITDIIGYFPTSLVILQTLKSPIIVNLTKKQVQQFEHEEPDWLINGQRGIIQYIKKNKKRE